MGVTGDFAKLGQLKASLQRTLKVPEAVAVKFAPELANFIKQEFTTGADPFGDPWKPLKLDTLRKGRMPPPLTATGAARDGVAVSAAGAKDRGTLAGYLRYHLTSRPVLPMRGEAWPDKWVQAIKDRAAGVIAELDGGKGR